MKNTYLLQVRARCPVNDNDIDLYAVTIESQYMIKVEAILECVMPSEIEKIFQEDLARKMAVELGAKVTIVGVHSGITVKSVAP